MSAVYTTQKYDRVNEQMNNLNHVSLFYSYYLNAPQPCYLLSVSNLLNSKLTCYRKNTKMFFFSSPNNVNYYVSKTISPEKTKIMSNKANGLTKTIKVKGYNLETVTNFNYLEAIVTDEGTKREVLTRIAQATSALTKLKTVWKDRKITSKHRMQILRSIVTSTFLYTCETWTLTAELERRIQTFEMRCYRKISGISFRERITNEDVRN